MIKYSLATNENINGILVLQSKNLVSNLKDDEKNDVLLQLLSRINK